VHLPRKVDNLQKDEDDRYRAGHGFGSNFRPSTEKNTQTLFHSYQILIAPLNPKRNGVLLTNLEVKLQQQNTFIRKCFHIIEKDGQLLAVLSLLEEVVDG
jgi:hypothetical protein